MGYIKTPHRKNLFMILLNNGILILSLLPKPIRLAITANGYTSKGIAPKTNKVSRKNSNI